METDAEALLRLRPRLAAQVIYPAEAWLFTVDVGEGCEGLELGLCRYPYTGAYLGSRRWRRWHSPANAVWQAAGFCKTQYAGRQGWEHFRRCHLAVIKLLAFWRTLGAKVVIDDEGGYWPRVSERTLARNLAEYDQCVAAFGGALRDVLTARGEQLEAPAQNPASVPSAHLAEQLAGIEEKLKQGEDIREDVGGVPLATGGVPRRADGVGLEARRDDCDVGGRA